MPPSRHEKHTETLHTLAGAIDRAGLRAPVSMALDVLRPLDFLSSQAVLFMCPFARNSVWERYVLALTEEHNWADLRRLLDLKSHKLADTEKKTEDHKPRSGKAEEA
jgi:hypothetical protein